MKQLERITFVVSEAKREEIQKVADNLSFTLSGLIKVAVSEYIEKHKS